MIALRWGIIETVGHGAVKIRLRGRGSKPGSRNWCLWWLFAEKVSRSFWVSKRFQSSPNFSRFTLPPTIMEMKNGSIWKVTSICMFFLGTHFWLPQDGYITILPPSNITSLAACWTLRCWGILRDPSTKSPMTIWCFASAPPTGESLDDHDGTWPKFLKQTVTKCRDLWLLFVTLTDDTLFDFNRSWSFIIIFVLMIYKLRIKTCLPAIASMTSTTNRDNSTDFPSLANTFWISVNLYLLFDPHRHISLLARTMFIDCRQAFLRKGLRPRRGVDRNCAEGVGL